MRLARAGRAGLLDLSLFRERSFSAGLAVQIVFWAGQASFFLVLALYLQQGRGLSALNAGLVFTILAAAYLFASMCAPGLTMRHGRGLLEAGALVLAEMESVCQALGRFLRAHEPYPAVLIDRRHDLVAANRRAAPLDRRHRCRRSCPRRRMRCGSLCPDGMAPRTINFAEWSASLMQRLRREISATRDPALEQLHAELAGYPGVELEPPHAESAAAERLLEDIDGPGR